jgi:hypothetical protein
MTKNLPRAIACSQPEAHDLDKPTQKATAPPASTAEQKIYATPFDATIEAKIHTDEKRNLTLPTPQPPIEDANTDLNFTVLGSYLLLMVVGIMLLYCSLHYRSLSKEPEAPEEHETTEQPENTEHTNLDYPYGPRLAIPTQMGM